MHRSRSVLIALLLSAATGQSAWADTVAPTVTVVARPNFCAASTPPDVLCFPDPFLTVTNGSTLNVCTGRPFQIFASALDNDGLGVPFFGSVVTYAWNFGTATPSTSLDSFSNRPRLTVNQRTSITLNTFDGAGNQRTFVATLRPAPCR